ncbi:transposase, partial [Microbulbifer sp. 2205BS26-8]|uniref:transposase n=1 Tax=Microbulbifer sp. 2205BS26-8 TaxID=3064386 RepID=UPI002767C002|nr:hypothetical protein [Microbulbifer sp. 2205BS26-8]
AWVLYEHLREQLQDTKLGKALIAILRNRLIKVGAVVIKNTRRFRFLLPTLLPDREIFCKLEMLRCEAGRAKFGLTLSVKPNPI